MMRYKIILHLFVIALMGFVFLSTGHEPVNAEFKVVQHREMIIFEDTSNTRKELIVTALGENGYEITFLDPSTLGLILPSSGKYVFEHFVTNSLDSRIEIIRFLISHPLYQSNSSINNMHFDHPGLETCAIKIRVFNPPCQLFEELYAIIGGDNWTDNTSWLYKSNLYTRYDRFGHLIAFTDANRIKIKGTYGTNVSSSYFSSYSSFRLNTEGDAILDDVDNCPQIEELDSNKFDYQIPLPSLKTHGLQNGITIATNLDTLAEQPNEFHISPEKDKEGE